MDVNPKDNYFTEKELKDLINNIIKEVVNNKYNSVMYNIKCTSKRYKFHFCIKKYKSINEEYYFLFDSSSIIDIDSKIDINNSGPVIVSKKSKNFETIINYAVDNIMTMQHKCILENLVMTLDIEDTTSNLISGIIYDPHDVVDEVFEKIEKLNLRYIEISFKLKEPEKTLNLYMHITRDRYIDVKFYTIAMIGTPKARITTEIDRIKDIFNTYVEEIYSNFKSMSEKPAVKIKWIGTKELQEFLQ
jgi:hypothetical protein